MDKSIIINLPSDIIGEIKCCVISPYKYTEGCCVWCGLALPFVDNPIVAVVMLNYGVFVYEFCSAYCFRNEARYRKKTNRMPLIVVSY